ncbi:MAG: protein kinase, partial [Myxococcota bacterium]|nr:protein kinase [Myxococcota bacterium]
MTQCPDKQTINAYIDGRLSADESRDVGTHISGCDTCKSIVSAELPSKRQGSVETAVTDFAPESGPTLKRPTALASKDSEGGQTPRLEISEWSMVSDQTAPSVDGDLNMLKAGSKLAHYVITRLIGRGGMGEVYLARDTHLGRKVALKVIIPTQLENPEALDRFLQEARMTARFNHPNIITIYGVGVVDGFPYVALEYLEGQNLQERCREERPTLQESLRFCLAIGEAVTEAHRHGVLHRDLKPANVLIPKDGRIRVADFGLAQQLNVTGHQGNKSARLEQQGDSTPPKKVVGTPAYMAPEQWRGQKTTEATDVWALGIILHELVVGKRPYAGLKAMQLGYKVCEPGPAPIGAELSGAPPKIEALVRRCLTKDPAQRPSAAHFTETVREVVSTGRRSGSADESPFRGLFPFSERHADMFFGRDNEIAGCIERLRYESTLAIIGPSGAGKTSFVQAGLIPRLRETSGRWTIIRVRPGEDPLRRLAGKIMAALADETASNSVDASGTDSVQGSSGDIQHAQTRLADIEELTAKIAAHPNTVNVALARVAEQRESKVLLLIDQLEELFTLCPDEDVQRIFIDAIGSAADEASDPVRLLCTLRDDFLGHMARLGPVSRSILERVAVISTPTPDALKDVLIRPLLATGYQFDDPSLADDMVAAVADAASLPLLQFAARSLWERRDQVARTLRRADYDAMGGVEGALARHADRVLEGLSEDELRAARGMLLRLVTPENTRRSVTETDLLTGLPSEATIVYERLTKSRLVSIRKGRSKDGGASRLELAHESLVVNWAVLSDWIAESREELVFLAEVGQAAELWERRGRRSEELWVGDGLVDALATLGRTTTEIPPIVVSFLVAGRRLRDRRIRRRRFWSTTIPIALSIIALIFALQKNEAEVAQQQSEQQRRQAVMERTAAENQRQQARKNQVDAIIEGAQAAYDRGAYLESRAKLRSALELSSAVTPQVRGLWWQLKNMPILWSQPYGSAIYSLRFANAGHLGAAATQAGGVYVFDTMTGLGRVLRGHGEQIVSISFSRDDQWLASGGYGKKIDIWDVERGERIRSLDVPDGLVVSVRFSPDRQYFVAGTSKGVVRTWQTKDWQHVDSGPADAMIRDVAIDAQGTVTALRIQSNKLLVTGRNAQDVRARLLVDPNVSIAFYLSEDGHRAVNMTRSGLVRIWDVQRGLELNRFSGGSGHRMGVTLDATGQRVAIAGADGIIRIFDVDTSRLMGAVPGTRAAAFTLGLSKDGDRLLFSEMRGELHMAHVSRVVNLSPAREKVKSIYGVAFSPSGRWVASMTRTGQVRLWELESGRKHPLFSPKDPGVPDAFAFSPDERYLAWADQAHRVRLWDLETMSSAGRLEKHTETVRALSFSADGQRLKTVGWDGFGEWDVQSKALIRFTRARIPRAEMATLNAGADRVLLGYGRNHLTSDVWSSKTGTLVTAFRGHTDAV